MEVNKTTKKEAKSIKDDMKNYSNIRQKSESSVEATSQVASASNWFD